VTARLRLSSKTESSSQSLPLRGRGQPEPSMVAERGPQTPPGTSERERDIIDKCRVQAGHAGPACTAFWGGIRISVSLKPSPLHVAKPHIISGSDIMGFSPHHLPRANIIPPPAVVGEKLELSIKSVSSTPPCGRTRAFPVGEGGSRRLTKEVRLHECHRF